jgi:hypothetical protein
VFVHVNRSRGRDKITTMRRTIFVWMVCALALAAGATTAQAQYGTRPLSNPAVGEDYHVEVSYGFWTPDREITISSESLGIVGSTIDVVTDLGFENETFQDFRVVLRPSRKFKLRFGYTPITYEADTTLNRTIVFNGQEFDVGVPITSRLEWRDWRFGLEWDFIYRDRGYLGFITEVKYTDVEVDITSPVTSEFTSVTVPIPTIGLGGRGYLTKNFSVTGEFTGLKLTINDKEGTYYNLDLYATFNFTNNFGVQGGYRTLNGEYLVDLDQGNLELKGLYFGAVARF